MWGIGVHSGVDRMGNIHCSHLYVNICTVHYVLFGIVGKKNIVRMMCRHSCPCIIVCTYLKFLVTTLVVQDSTLYFEVVIIWN